MIYFFYSPVFPKAHSFHSLISFSLHRKIPSVFCIRCWYKYLIENLSEQKKKRQNEQRRNDNIQHNIKWNYHLLPFHMKFNSHTHCFYTRFLFMHIVQSFLAIWLSYHITHTHRERGKTHRLKSNKMAMSPCVHITFFCRCSTFISETNNHFILHHSKLPIFIVHFTPICKSPLLRFFCCWCCCCFRYWEYVLEFYIMCEQTLQLLHFNFVV